MSRFLSTAASLAVAVCVLSTSASAQMRGEKRGEYSNGNGSLAGPPTPPLVPAIALDRGKDLALTDSQRTVIEALKVTQESETAALRARLDSMRPVQGANMTAEMQEEMQVRQRGMQLVFAAWREFNDGARQKLFAVLTPDQQKKFKEYEDDENNQFENELRKRMRAMNSNGGGASGGGSSGGRRRPPEV